MTATDHLSRLSRGIGEIHGTVHERIDVVLEEQDYRNFTKNRRRKLYRKPTLLPRLPSINNSEDIVKPPNGSYEELSRRLARRAAGGHKTRPVPRTFSTRKGALLLFSEDLAATNEMAIMGDKPHRRKSRDDDKEDDNLETVGDFARSILDYGSKPSAVKLIIGHRQTGGGCGLRPGFSAHRYLSRFSKCLGDDFLVNMINKGYVNENSVYESNSLVPRLRQRIIDDISCEPQPYKLLKSMLVEPGLLSGYTFNAVAVQAEPEIKIDRDSSRIETTTTTPPEVNKIYIKPVQSEQSEPLGNLTVQIKDPGTAEAKTYGDLCVDEQSRVLTDLLVKSTINFALEKQKEILADEEQEQRDLQEAAQSSVISRCDLYSLNMAAAVSNYLASQHRIHGNESTSDDDDSSATSRSMKGLKLKATQRKRYGVHQRMWPDTVGDKEYIGGCPVASVRDCIPRLHSASSSSSFNNSILSSVGGSACQTAQSRAHSFSHSHTGSRRRTSSTCSDSGQHSQPKRPQLSPIAGSREATTLAASAPGPGHNNNNAANMKDQMWRGIYPVIPAIDCTEETEERELSSSVCETLGSTLQLSTLVNQPHHSPHHSTHHHSTHHTTHHHTEEHRRRHREQPLLNREAVLNVDKQLAEKHGNWTMVQNDNAATASAGVGGVSSADGLGGVSGKRRGGGGGDAEGHGGHDSSSSSEKTSNYYYSDTKRYHAQYYPAHGPRCYIAHIPVVSIQQPIGDQCFEGKVNARDSLRPKSASDITRRLRHEERSKATGSLTDRDADGGDTPTQKHAKVAKSYRRRGVELGGRDSLPGSVIGAPGGDIKIGGSIEIPTGNNLHRNSIDSAATCLNNTTADTTTTADNPSTGQLTGDTKLDQSTTTQQLNESTAASLLVPKGRRRSSVVSQEELVKNLTEHAHKIASEILSRPETGVNLIHDAQAASSLWLNADQSSNRRLSQSLDKIQEAMVDTFLAVQENLQEHESSMPTGDGESSSDQDNLHSTDEIALDDINLHTSDNDQLNSEMISNSSLNNKQKLPSSQPESNVGEGEGEVIDETKSEEGKDDDEEIENIEQGEEGGGGGDNTDPAICEPLDKNKDCNSKESHTLSDNLQQDDSKVEIKEESNQEDLQTEVVSRSPLPEATPLAPVPTSPPASPPSTLPASPPSTLAKPHDTISPDSIDEGNAETPVEINDVANIKSNHLKEKTGIHFSKSNKSSLSNVRQRSTLISSRATTSTPSKEFVIGRVPDPKVIEGLYGPVNTPMDEQTDITRNTSNLIHSSTDRKTLRQDKSLKKVGKKKSMKKISRKTKKRSLPKDVIDQESHIGEDQSLTSPSGTRSSSKALVTSSRKESSEEMEFVIVRDEFSDDSDEDETNKSDDEARERLRREEDHNRAELLKAAANRIPSSISLHDEEPEINTTGMSAEMVKELRAQRREAQIARRKAHAEKKKKEKEDEMKRIKEEKERAENMKRELEEETLRREQERRANRETREKAEREEEERERAQERLRIAAIEREKREKEEYIRRREEIKRKQAEIDRLRKEEEARLEKERIEFETQEALKISLMAEEERIRYAQEKEMLKEQKRLALEAEKKRLAEEAERSRLEAIRIAEEMARAKAELERRLAFQRGLLVEADGLDHTQDVTRAFTFSYFELLQWLGIEISDIELLKIATGKS